MDQNHLNNFQRGPYKDHFYQVLSKSSLVKEEMPLEANVDDIGCRTHDGHPLITIACHEPMAQVS